MHHRTFLGAVSLVACTAVLILQVGVAVADSVVLTPTIDIYTDATTVVDDGTLKIANPTDIIIPGPENRALLKFDVSSIPTGSTINTAEIHFNQLDTQTIYFGAALVKRINEPWDLNTSAQDLHDIALIGTVGGTPVTGLNVFSNNTSGTAGDPGSLPGVHIFVGGPQLKLKTKAVQLWVNGTEPNYGISLVGSEGFGLTGREFDSSTPNPVATDFDGNDVVNDVDLGIWETNFGTASGALKTSGDADGDTDVDGNDFLTWQQDNGKIVLPPTMFIDYTPPTASPAAAGVPEPSSAITGLIAAGLLILIRSRRQ